MLPADERTWFPTGKWRCVVVALLVAAATSAHGAPPCVLTGVGRLAVVADGLRLVESEAPPLQSDDVLLQINDRRLRTCDDLVAALKAAEQRQLVPVVLLRRGDATRTEALSWPPAEPVASATPHPTPLTVADADSLADMAGELRAFGEQLSLPLLAPQPFTRRLGELRQTLLAHRDRTAIGAVQPILGYYETVAEILDYKEKAAAEAPASQGDVAVGAARTHRHALGSFPYTSDGPVAKWVDRYPFLQSSVTQRTGSVGPFEQTGLWQPDEAIRLLVTRARTETAALARQAEDLRN